MKSPIAPSVKSQELVLAGIISHYIKHKDAPLTATQLAQDEDGWNACCSS
jgi:hypothetical protein